MNKLLNEAQLAVLQWVAEGQPKGVYDDGFEHRVTARALERRGLVKVRGHGHSWTAAVTAGGHFYLEHGRYEPSQEPTPAPESSGQRHRTRSAPPAPNPVPIKKLIGQLRTAGGLLRIDSPTDADRVSYRQAVERARADGEIAFHERLKLTGTKRGPLVVELLRVADTVAPTISVPDETNPRHPAVRAAATRLPDVGEPAKPRALALIQAIADECSARGWTMAFDDAAGFEVAIGEESYRCYLFEEQEKRDVYPDVAIAQRKYEWQRVSPTRMDIFTGRLRLEIGRGYGALYWADRKRRTLALKLPDFFNALDERSAAEREKRSRLAQAHRDSVARWEQAVPRARVRYLLALNAERAATQLAAWKRASDLRAYAGAVEARAHGIADETQRVTVEGWSAWLRDEAGRVEPLADVDQLHVDEPREISTADLDKYMPKGWTSRRPPDPPTWLPS